MATKAFFIDDEAFYREIRVPLLAKLQSSGMYDDFQIPGTFENLIGHIFAILESEPDAEIVCFLDDDLKSYGNFLANNLASNFSPRTSIDKIHFALINAAKKFNNTDLTTEQVVIQPSGRVIASMLREIFGSKVTILGVSDVAEAQKEYTEAVIPKTGTTNTLSYKAILAYEEAIKLKHNESDENTKPQ